MQPSCTKSHQTVNASKTHHFPLHKACNSGTPVYPFYLLASILGHQIKLDQGNILKENTVLVGKTATHDSIFYCFRECQNLGCKQQDRRYHLTAWCTYELKAYEINYLQETTKYRNKFFNNLS